MRDNLQKHTLNLFRGDYEKLQAAYPDVGAGPIIRRVVRHYLQQIESGAEIFDPKAEINI